MTLLASLPPVLDRADVAARLAGADARLVGWDLQAPPSDGVRPEQLDVVVLPFHTLSPTTHNGYVRIDDVARALPAATRARLVQLLSLGSEGIPELVPDGALLANAVGAMERQTAELAVALLLAQLRDVVGFATAGRWHNRRTPGLLGATVLLLGHGGVGREVERRLDGFDVRLVRVARTARTLPDGSPVHSIDRLGELAATADALVCTLPLTAATRGLVDARVLAALPDGAVVVNVGRGPVLDTDALVEEVRRGRLRAALDVTDPEPLPDGHPLWSLPGALVTPHVGGNTPRMLDLLAELVAAQIRRLVAGEAPANVIGGPR